MTPLSEKETENYINEYLSLYSNQEIKITPKRLNDFYHLTEGKISSINHKINDFFNASTGVKKSDKFLRQFSVGLMVLLMAQALAFLISYKPKPNLEVQVASKEDRTEPSKPLISQIPPYFAMATLQLIEPAPIRQKDFIANNEEETFDSSLVLIDKVVVAPKILALEKNIKTAKLDQELIKPIQK